MVLSGSTKSLNHFWHLKIIADADKHIYVDTCLISVKALILFTLILDLDDYRMVSLMLVDGLVLTNCGYPGMEEVWGCSRTSHLQTRATLAQCALQPGKRASKRRSVKITGTVCTMLHRMRVQFNALYKQFGRRAVFRCCSIYQRHQDETQAINQGFIQTIPVWRLGRC